MPLFLPVCLGLMHLTFRGFRVTAQHRNRTCGVVTRKLEPTRNNIQISRIAHSVKKKKKTLARSPRLGTPSYFLLLFTLQPLPLSFPSRRQPQNRSLSISATESALWERATHTINMRTRTTLSCCSLGGPGACHVVLSNSARFVKP
ncbi:hypothetical protein BaRGS_00027668 [Batillaria attramentaria]|uniref:Secreted protein n=1 Tax=Batillaria attramentaria TaxID=370345 RepID=A0ABD0K1T0_9CAEN